MKKGLKITLVILGVIILIALICFAVSHSKIKNNTIATKKAVIVKVNENSLDVVDIKNPTSFLSVSFSKEGNIGFKPGQEILIYSDGMVVDTVPGKLCKVGKIKILKEESDVVIPDDVFRFYYNSYNNVDVTVFEATSKGISFTITDTNEKPYEYSNKYIINKKIKNEEYTGIGEKLGEDTGNSIAGYTRNRN